MSHFLDNDGNDELRADVLSSAQAPGGRRSTVHDTDASLTQRMSVSLGASTTPAFALAQVAPLDPAAAEVSVSDSEASDSEAESSDSEAELPPPPHETATGVASTM